MTTTADALLVFARAPELGETKTRLAAGLGQQQALDAYRLMVERTLDTCVQSGLPVTLCLTDSTTETEAWLRSGLFSRMQQVGGDLGERMFNAIRSALRAGHRRVVLIGVDCPVMTTDYLHDAFDKLHHADLVLGPVEDGGYVLIGMRAEHSMLFEGINWGSADVLAATLTRARQAGLIVELLEQLWDVDTPQDWARYLAWSKQEG